tara:strand:+ start:219 stop:812 length:594 start_codon:yes stop_codon:yes gene_type:complete
MSLTTLVTFVEVFSINENSVRDSKYFLQNAKRGKFDEMRLAGETNDAQINIENKVVENSISFDSGTVPGRGLQTYYYLPFVYQGTTINRSGDNIESNLIMANHPLSMAKAQEAVINKYFVEVNVCIMKNDDIDTLANGDQSILTTDTWLASSLSYDPEVVEVLLSSAIDSVGGNVPSLVLTTEVVGKLPVTSDIQNR